MIDRPVADRTQIDLADVEMTGMRSGAQNLLVRLGVDGQCTRVQVEPEPGVINRIRALIGEHAVGAIEAHDLRTRQAGRLTFVEFHLVVPGAMSVAESHAICDRIEAALKTDMTQLRITIHVEPEAKAKQAGVLVL